MKQLHLRNTQRARTINTKRLREIARRLLEEHLAAQTYELAVHLVSARKIVELNEHFLRHHGSTDVITFDYSDGYEGAAKEPAELRGEIFISVDDAMKQAREFRTTWQQELVRYLVHGVLHLHGYDDLEAGKRKVMKREENRLLKRLTRQFPLKQLAA
jgi:probable rRNA maturation factor